MSMAASLEVRCPLLDHELAEMASGLPHGWKIANGRGKQILLKAIGGRLPAELLTRPKMGFGVPLSDWFRSSLREMLWDRLTTKRFLERGIVSGPFVRKLLEEHQSGRRDNQQWLWSLLVLEMWWERVWGDGHSKIGASLASTSSITASGTASSFLPPRAPRSRARG
jgi:asparagine synthase (glutamine-hydrolysing)